MYGRKSPVAVVEGAESLSKGGQRLRGHAFLFSVTLSRAWMAGEDGGKGKGRKGVEAKER